MEGENKQLPKGFYVTQKTAIFLSLLFIIIVVGVALLFYFVPRQEQQQPCEEVVPVCEPQLPAVPVEPTETPREPFEERLPETLYPEHYEIYLTMYLDEEDDDKRFTFEGRERIRLRCEESTDIIKMNSRFLNVDVDSEDAIEIQELSSGDSVEVSRAYLDDVHELFVIELAVGMEAGNIYEVRINNFGAPMGDAADDQWGMYYQSYDIGGETRWICNTKFTPNYAREVFPSYDEPHFRSTFDLVIAHRSKRWAMSNMPITHNVTLDDDWIETHFNTTPNMVTYLLVMVLADFPSVETTTKYGYPFRVWAREDRLYAANYSLYTGSEMLTYFEELIDVPYGLPKMDMVAIPDYAAGATEFWGCILYRESRLLYDEDVNTPYNQQSVAAIIAHELAHMWFGNYLTCDWWSEIWLNEGFASFYEFPAVDHVHPDWKMDHQFSNLDLESAFRVDAASSSAAPLVRPVSGWRDEITGVFDTTSYSGGSSRYRSLRAFLGADVIHAGIVSYVKNNLYSPVVSDQLWEELTLADAAHGGTNVKKVMDTWSLQHGHPVVTVNRTTSSMAVVTQQHFLSDPNDAVTDKWPNLGYTWYVPMTYTFESDLTFDDPLKHFQWLNKEVTGELDLSMASASDWVVVNLNQVGFYRVNYDDENWNRLAEQLKTDHDVIPAQTRTALMDDCFKISQAFYTDTVNCLRLSEYLDLETEYPTWELMIDNLPFLYRALMRTAEFGQFEFYWRQQITPLYDSLGWDMREGDTLEYRLRQEAINTACGYGNEDCVKQASDLFSEWMDTGINPTPSEVKSTVYCTAIKHGGTEEWIFAHEESLTNIAERSNLRSALGCSKDAWQLERYIEEYFTDSQEVYGVINSVREKSATGFAVAWHYVMNNFEKLRSSIGEESAYSVVWDFYPWMNTDYDLQQLLSFGAQREDMPSASASGFHNCKLEVETNIAWMSRNRDSVRGWLDEVTSQQTSTNHGGRWRNRN
ncbi:aminopeptidase N-like isoform X2 [Ptychodera flava]